MASNEFNLDTDFANYNWFGTNPNANAKHMTENKQIKNNAFAGLKNLKL